MGRRRQAPWPVPHLGHGRAPAGVVDDRGHDALDVVVPLGVVHHAVLGRALAVGVVGLEDRPTTLTLGPDDAAHLHGRVRERAAYLFTVGRVTAGGGAEPRPLHSCRRCAPSRQPSRLRRRAGPCSPDLRGWGLAERPPPRTRAWIDPAAHLGKRLPERGLPGREGPLHRWRRLAGIASCWRLIPLACQHQEDEPGSLSGAAERGGTARASWLEYCAGRPRPLLPPHLSPGTRVKDGEEGSARAGEGNARGVEVARCCARCAPWPHRPAGSHLGTRPGRA